ncbi:suppressor protein SRP40-like [Helianthus annuus]|uniref:suppressor protein SRP40-like n=1 Tax=Helianthus annuus TaxID=4232 RepID=UPI000B8FC3BA|nr:suppressor protein SRP40-like [Helianthus annuus]
MERNMYGEPIPVASEQSHHSTGVSSFLDTNCNDQTKTRTAFCAKIIKDVSIGESSGNDDRSEHDGSSVEDGTSSSSSEDGSEYESTREVIDFEANESISISESESSQKEKKDVTCIGYKKCPPPVRHNYDAMPDEENRTHFAPSVSLNFEEFTTGHGYKMEVSSDSDVSTVTSVSTAEQNLDPPVIVEDADSSDDKSDDTDSAQSDAK